MYASGLYEIVITLQIKATYIAVNGALQYTSPVKPHLGWFAQVKLGTKKSQKKQKQKHKLSGCANLPYAEKNVFFDSGNHFLQISGLKKIKILAKK